MKCLRVSVFLCLFQLCRALAEVPQLPVNHDLALRFDASAIRGVGDGALLTAWPDTSGNSRNGSRGGYGAYSGPHFYTNVQNRLPAVRFGTYGGADVGEWFRFSSVTPRHVFFVAKDMRGGGQSQVMGQGSRYDWHNGGPSAAFSGAYSKAANWIGKLDGTNIVLTAQRWVQFKPFILSIELPQEWTAFTDRMCSDRDGYGYRTWGGEIYEVLLYTAPLLPEEELRVGSFLQYKWDIDGVYPPFLLPPRGVLLIVK